MIRAANFELIKKKEGLNNRQLGEAMSCSGAYIGRLLARKTPFTEDTARRIEEIFKKPYRWMDQIHFEGEYDQDHAEYKEVIKSERLMTNEPPLKWEHESAKTPVDQALLSAKTTTKAPVVAWALLDEAVTKSNRDWPEEAHVVIAPIIDRVSDLTKVVEVLDSPLPTISRGDMIAVDPQAKPWHDCVIVVSLPGATMPMLRRYRAVTGGGYEAICPIEPALDSNKHDLVLVGVVVALHKRNF
jgi:plasmid maintenance system antidote protein VapI